MTIISERLQHLRLTHGYTQTDLARTMGVTRRTVYAWEHDKCPEIPHLIQLAPILSGVDRLSIGADGVRCSPPPEALPDTFCLL